MLGRIEMSLFGVTNSCQYLKNKIQYIYIYKQIIDMHLYIAGPRKVSGPCSFLAVEKDSFSSSFFLVALRLPFTQFFPILVRIFFLPAAGLEHYCVQCKNKFWGPNLRIVLNRRCREREREKRQNLRTKFTGQNLQNPQFSWAHDPASLTTALNRRYLPPPPFITVAPHSKLNSKTVV